MTYNGTQRLLSASAQTATANHRHYRCLNSSLTKTNAKNNCDHFINFMGAGFGLPAGDW
jgi:hypothetical protein